MPYIERWRATARAKAGASSLPLGREAGFVATAPAIAMVGDLGSEARRPC
jgi:hypothetical protein